MCGYVTNAQLPGHQTVKKEEEKKRKMKRIMDLWCLL